MKYVALANKPNVSESRLENVSPSLKLDDRGFPCISWLGLRDGANEVNYRYWDGLQWAFNGIPSVYKSKETIIYSPNSLVLDSDENPAIAFSRRSAMGSKHSIATSPLMNGEWTFNELDVDYSTEWIGITKYGHELDVSSSSSSSSSSSNGSNSSSSSSSSYEAPLFFVSIYDSTNEEIKIYSVSNQSWTLIGSKSVIIDDASTIRIDSCGSEIGIAYFDDSGIWYNFFDINTQVWSTATFTLSSESELYGTVRDMDFSGYHDASNGFMAVGWVSGDSTTSYVCSILIRDDGTETSSDGLSTVVESSSVNVTCSSDYIINGYKKISVCVDNSGVPQMITSGASSKVFLMYEIGVDRARINSSIDISSPSNGIVPSSIRVAFRGSSDVVLSMALDSGDIYFFENSSDDTFPISTPNMAILNNEWLYLATYSDGQLQGTQVSGTYDSYCANILREAKRPVIVISDRTLTPPTTTTTTTLFPTTTTTTTTSIYCCTSMQPDITLGHGGVLSSWNIDWMGHDSPGCELLVYIAWPTGAGMGFILVKNDGSGTPVAYGETLITAAQTINLLPSGSSYVEGTVYWNGIQIQAGDVPGPYLIHC